MRKAKLYLLLFPVWVMVVSCGETDDDQPAEKVAERLAIKALTDGMGATWTVSRGGSVSKDGNLINSDFPDFELRLTSSASNSYVSSMNPLFDQSGQWSFTGANFDKIKLTGSRPAAGREISFSRAEDKLTLMFNIAMSGPDQRVKGVAGSYIFVLVKKEEIQ